MDDGQIHVYGVKTRKRHIHEQIFDCDLDGLREKADTCDGITYTKAATSVVYATDAIAPTFNKVSCFSRELWPWI